MDSFWSKILILAIVATLGYVFISKVYTPQKEAQSVMADTSTQTLNAVKSEIDSTQETTATQSSVFTSIDLYYSDVNVIVAIGNSANKSAYVDVTNGVATIQGTSTGAEFAFAAMSSKDALKALATASNYTKTVYKSSTGATVLIKFDPI